MSRPKTGCTEKKEASTSLAFIREGQGGRWFVGWEGLRQRRASVERVQWGLERRQIRRGAKGGQMQTTNQSTIGRHKQSTRRGEKREANELRRALKNGDLFTKRKRSKSAKASVLANKAIGVVFRRIGSGFCATFATQKW